MQRGISAIAELLVIAYAQKTRSLYFRSKLDKYVCHVLLCIIFGRVFYYAICTRTTC